MHSAFSLGVRRVRPRGEGGGNAVMVVQMHPTRVSFLSHQPNPCGAWKRLQKDPSMNLGDFGFISLFFSLFLLHCRLTSRPRLWRGRRDLPFACSVRPGGREGRQLVCNRIEGIRVSLTDSSVRPFSKVFTDTEAWSGSDARPISKLSRNHASNPKATTRLYTSSPPPPWRSPGWHSHRHHQRRWRSTR